MRYPAWLIMVLTLVGACCLTATAALKWVDADHANNDHWSNALNWNSGTAPGWVPTAADDTLVIRAAGIVADPCVATAGQLGRTVHLGYWSFDGTLHIQATGELTADNVLVGNGTGPLNTGVLNIDGGTLNSRVMNVGTNGTSTVGIVNLNGGQINLDVQIVVGNNGHSGRFNLYDGVADVGKLYVGINGGTGLIDIHSGTLVVTNVDSGLAQYNSVLNMIATGKIIGFDGVGTVQAAWDGAAVTTVTASGPTTAATLPHPSDGMTGVPQGVVLTWLPGELSASQDIYLGEDMASVASATPATPVIYRGRQGIADGSRFATVDLLAGVSYYWRVDGVASDGVTIYPGPVWQFTVATTNPVCTWVPTAGTDWFVPANWNVGFVPTAYTDANIYKPTDLPVIGGGSARARNMLIGVHGFATQLTVENTGTLHANRIDLGKHNAGTSGTLLVNGGTVETAGMMNVGYSADNTGTLTLQAADGVDPCVVVGSELSIAVQAGSIGTINLKAGQLTCTALTINATGGTALLNIEKGRLVIPGDVTAAIAGHVSAGTITAYNHHPRGHVAVAYLDGQEQTVVTASAPDNLSQAWYPRPADRALIEDDHLTLAWAAGDAAAYHDVYFGMDRQAILDADINTPALYRGRVANHAADPQNNGFVLPDALSFGRQHYWRIDTVEADGVTIHTGQVWQFDKACPAADLNGDCSVDMQDFGIMASEWTNIQ